MADSEVRQKFEAWAESAGYVSIQDAFEAGMRAGEIARWIPVEEKLPEENCWVRTLEKMTAGSQRVRFFCARPKTFWETGSCPDTNVTYFVTHWQPLEDGRYQRWCQWCGLRESYSYDPRKPLDGPIKLRKETP